MSRRTSMHEHATSELFERLVAGQESAEGEAPPAYEDVVVAASLSGEGGGGGASVGVASPPPSGASSVVGH